MSQTRSKRLTQAIALFSIGAAAQSKATAAPISMNQPDQSATDLQVAQAYDDSTGDGHTDSHTMP